MAWFCLIITGILEVGWAIGMKYADRFTKPLSSIFTIIIMIASFFVFVFGP